MPKLFLLYDLYERHHIVGTLFVAGFKHFSAPIHKMSNRLVRAASKDRESILDLTAVK